MASERAVRIGAGDFAMVSLPVGVGYWLAAMIGAGRGLVNQRVRTTALW
jgi:hypothetical protein